MKYHIFRGFYVGCPGIPFGNFLLFGVFMLVWYSLFSLALFFLIWVLGFWLVAYFSGWLKLASAYRSKRLERNGQRFSWQSIGLHWWASYNNCVQFALDVDGCHIWLAPLFDFGHPALFVPWEEINIKEETGFFGKYDVLLLSAFPDTPIRIRPRLAASLREARAARSTEPSKKQGDD